MATTITITLPDQIYEKAKQLAHQQHQEVNEMLLAEIMKTIDAKVKHNTDESSLPENNVDESVERERQAYVAMHSYLKQKYFGKHVAIYQGELVDFDDDYSALYDRIDQKYPNTFVWLDTVSENAEEIISLRSPLFVEDSD